MCHKTKPENNYLRKERQFRKKKHLRKDRKKSQNRVYMIAKKFLGKIEGIWLMMYWRKKI